MNKLNTKMLIDVGPIWPPPSPLKVWIQPWWRLVRLRVLYVDSVGLKFYLIFNNFKYFFNSSINITSFIKEIFKFYVNFVLNFKNFQSCIPPNKFCRHHIRTYGDQIILANFENRHVRRTRILRV